MPKSNAWKNLERQVAEHFSGIRIHRGGDFSESLPDVVAPLQSFINIASEDLGLIVECKYRAKQPWIAMYKKMARTVSKLYNCTVLTKEMINPLTQMKDTFMVMDLSKVKDYYNAQSYVAKTFNLKKKVPDYLLSYYMQALEYNTNLDTLDKLQLLYYKASNDRTRPRFKSYRSIAVIGQKNDKVKLACFFRSDFQRIQDAQSDGQI